MTEVWKRVPISPYKNYEVSSQGRVRRNGKILKPVITGDGYHAIKLSYAGLPRRFRINRLVCETFHGPAFEGADAAHTDGNRANNSADNLSWKSRKDNVADKKRHGTAQIGESAGGAKLTWENVAELRRRIGGGEQITAVAKEFGISRSHAGNIASRSRNLWDDSAVPQGFAQPTGSIKGGDRG